MLSAGAALTFCNSAHAVAEVEMTDFLHSKSSSAFAKVKRINKIVLSPIEIGLSSAPWFSLTRIMASSLVFIDGIGRECCATGDRPKRSCGRHRPVVGHQCLFTFLERATFDGRRAGGLYGRRRLLIAGVLLFRIPYLACASALAMSKSCLSLALAAGAALPLPDRVSNLPPFPSESGGFELDSCLQSAIRPPAKPSCGRPRPAPI
jgi:hypothetical protein